MFQLLDELVDVVWNICHFARLFFGASASNNQILLDLTSKNGLAFETTDANGTKAQTTLTQDPSSGPVIIATNKAPERIIVRTDAAGNSVVLIQGREMSVHASGQATKRGISNESIADALDQEPFQYIQNGSVQNGYYDASTNTFVGVGDRITTVIRPKNPENYLNNLRNRR